MSKANSDDQWSAGGDMSGITTIGDPALTRVVRPINDFQAAQGLFDELVTMLRQLNGAGLAAPQIGHAIAAFAVEVRQTDVFPDRETSPLIVMANPTITDQSTGQTTDWEGCFSIPGLLGVVPRYSTIAVTFHTPEGDKRQQEYSGYLARVIQHEIDHLNGTTFMHRMNTVDSLTTVHNYRKFHQR